MSIWTLIQIVFDIFMACGLFVVVMRMNRAPKDDPRMSRGLALLQSKIAVLEDLSDRTEQQVSGLVSILETKAREVQAKVELADRHVNEIRVSMERSLEVASIFQDKIPHKEIIERQNTLKYVTAARLAHSGMSIEDISLRVDLPRGELDFIASVNRDRLMFNEDSLPEWAKTAMADESAAGTDSGAGASGGSMNDSTDSSEAIDASNDERARRLRAEIELAENQRLVDSLSRLQFEMQNLDMQLANENKSRDVASAYEVPKVETDHLKKLGEEFRKAVREGEVADSRQMFAPIENLASMIPSILDAASQIPSAAQPARVVATAAPQTQSAYAAAVNANANAAANAQRATQQAATTQDPVLARAAAQAKVQAALRSSSPQPPRSAASMSNDLANARAVARSAASSPKSSAPKAAPGEVRKVMFPRIDGSDV
jgi:hypothetical protein